MSELLKQGEIYRTLTAIETNGNFTVPPGTKVIFVQSEPLEIFDCMNHIFRIKKHPDLEFGLTGAQVVEKIEGMKAFLKEVAPV